jgi:hypothetical protein
MFAAADVMPFAYADGSSAILVLADERRQSGQPVMYFRFLENADCDDAASTTAASASHTHDAGRPVVPNSGAGLSCRCKYSRCLKMYCECLAAAVACKDSCRCTGCQNLGNTLGVRKRLARNISVLAGIPVVCRCRRSKCIKKYCDCYKNGATCGYNCTCTDCDNQTTGL